MPPATLQSPKPPYYAVIFTSKRTEGDHGYAAMAERMEALANEQPGFLGIESARTLEGFGISATYWKDEASARAWKQVARHLEAQRAGRERWYAGYRVRVAKVEREYGYERE